MLGYATAIKQAKKRSDLKRESTLIRICLGRLGTNVVVNGWKKEERSVEDKE